MRGLFAILFILLFTTSIPVKASQANRSESTRPQTQPTKPEIEIVFIDNKIRVNNATIGSTLEIYSVVGLKVFDVKIKYPSGDYPVNLPKGYYIVRIGETVRKIVVR